MLDAILIGNDFGSQTCMMVDPDTLREFVFPGTKKLIEQAKSYGLTVMHHSCGSIFPVIQDLADLGADIIHPIQALANEMDAPNLKNHFTGKVAFCGRAAVKMPPVTITAANELRTIVRRERRVELAFEGLRYYDILRWGIAADELTGVFTGMKLTNDPTHYTADPIDSEGYYKFETKNFKKGINELWPIPQTERDINKNLTQNPGY